MLALAGDRGVAGGEGGEYGGLAGEEQADRMLITPFWAMWSANILIGAAGLYLLVKSAREIRFLSWSWLEKITPEKLKKLLR